MTVGRQPVKRIVTTTEQRAGSRRNENAVMPLVPRGRCPPSAEPARRFHDERARVRSGAGAAHRR